MKREIRKLNLMDAFLVSDIISKLEMDIRAENLIQDFTKYENEDEAIMAIGGQFIMEIFKNFSKAQNEIFTWLVEFSDDLTLEDVRYMPLMEIKDMIKEKFMGEDVEAFFKSLLQNEKK